MIEVLSEVIAARKFPEWTMGFRDLNLYSPELPKGFNSLLNEPWNTSILSDGASEMRAFIEVFMR